MALSILSNAAVNQAAFSLNKNSSKLQQSLTRLSREGRSYLLLTTLVDLRYR